MLLNFKVKNYKSFKDEAIFSLEPAPRQTGLNYSVQETTIGSKIYRSLCSAVIYGPNAAGKTNLIGAMDTMKAIVSRGHIRNDDKVITPNAASYILEMVPNCNNGISPTVFSIKFIEKGLLFEYAFSIELGEFANSNYDRKILNETLKINNNLIFSRTDTLNVNFPKALKKYLNSEKIQKSALSIALDGLNHDELFLCNGFKTIFSKEIVLIITEWFENKFMVVYQTNQLKMTRRFSNPNENTIYIEKTLTEAAKTFGITGTALGFKQEGETMVLCSIFKDKNLIIPAETFESYGTNRFVEKFPLIINALINGATLIMDEFDSSIHPMALINLITIFHNDEINKNHAQLIFNTHNPIFLDSSLFRRDEIKFVEMDEQTHCSTHYSLSDFKTANGIRKGEDYMKNYFINRYGAIREIDFSSLIEKLINKNQEVNNE